MKMSVLLADRVKRLAIIAATAVAAAAIKTAVVVVLVAAEVVVVSLKVYFQPTVTCSSVRLQIVCSLHKVCIKL